MWDCLSVLLIVYASILFSVTRERWFINVAYFFLYENGQLIIFMKLACIWVCVLCIACGMWIRIHFAGLFQNDSCNFLSCDFLSALQQMMGFVVERISFSLHFWYCICCIFLLLLHQWISLHIRESRPILMHYSLYSRSVEKLKQEEFKCENQERE